MKYKYTRRQILKKYGWGQYLVKRFIDDLLSLADKPKEYMNGENNVTDGKRAVGNRPKEECKHELSQKQVTDDFGVASYTHWVDGDICEKCGMSVLDWKKLVKETPEWFNSLPKTKPETCLACEDPLSKYIHVCKNHQILNSKTKPEKVSVPDKLTEIEIMKRDSVNTRLSLENRKKSMR